MAIVYPVRTADTSQTQGGGPINMSGIAPQINLRTFDQVCSVGDEVRYVAVVNRIANEWEEGIYFYTGTDQLTAATILDSSIGGAKINFGPGTKDVFVTSSAQVMREADAAALSAAGVAVLDFGPWPGKANTSVIVSTPIASPTRSVAAWVVAMPTSDHSADEHWLDPPEVYAGNIVPFQGFTIYGKSSIERPVQPGRRIPMSYGRWNVGWVWK